MRYGSWWRILLAVPIAALAAGAACSQSVSDPATYSKDHSSRQTRVPGEYLVTLTPEADVKAITDSYGRFGIKGTQQLGHDLFLVRLAEDPGPAKLDELRAQNPQIRAIQPNYVYRSQGRGKVQ